MWDSFYNYFPPKLYLILQSFVKKFKQFLFTLNTQFSDNIDQINIHLSADFN